MMTGSDGVGNVRLPRPSFTYTNTFPTDPSLPTTSVSVLRSGLAFWQYGSELSFTGCAGGGVPANVTLPVMVAAVAASTGAAGAAAPPLAGAGAAGCVCVAVCWV